jgi:hypothetical protein
VSDVVWMMPLSVPSSERAFFSESVSGSVSNRRSTAGSVRSMAMM